MEGKQGTMTENTHAIDLLSLKTIERISLILSGIALLLAAIFAPTWQVFTGLIAGSLIAILNFKSLRRVTTKMLNEGKGKSRNGLRFFIKIILLFGIVGGLIFYVKVDAVAFLAGFSTIVVAILIEGVRSLL